MLRSTHGVSRFVKMFRDLECGSKDNLYVLKCRHRFSIYLIIMDSELSGMRKPQVGLECVVLTRTLLIGTRHVLRPNILHILLLNTQKRATGKHIRRKQI